MAQSSSCSHTEMKVDCRSIYSRAERGGGGGEKSLAPPPPPPRHKRSKRIRLTSRGASVGLPPADRCASVRFTWSSRGGRRHSCVGSEENPLWQRMSRFLPGVSSAWKCTKSAGCFCCFTMIQKGAFIFKRMK